MSNVNVMCGLLNSFNDAVFVRVNVMTVRVSTLTVSSLTQKMPSKNCMKTATVRTLGVIAPFNLTVCMLYANHDPESGL